MGTAMDTTLSHTEATQAQIYLAAFFLFATGHTGALFLLLLQQR